jgi:Fis family transcriptional regulator
MKIGAVATVESIVPGEGLAVQRTDHTEPLSTCVRNAMRFYLHHLGDYEATDLYQLVLREMERPLIEILLEHTQGNQTQAARMLGMSRSTLRKKMAQHGLVGRD